MSSYDPRKGETRRKSGTSCYESFGFSRFDPAATHVTFDSACLMQISSLPCLTESLNIPQHVGQVDNASAATPSGPSSPRIPCCSLRLLILIILIIPVDPFTSIFQPEQRQRYVFFLIRFAVVQRVQSYPPVKQGPSSPVSLSAKRTPTPWPSRTRTTHHGYGRY